jgi:hypothetical protein
MEITADQAELFPVVESRAGKRGMLREFMDAVEKHGPLLPRGMLHYVLDLSRQRVHQLVCEDRIALVDVQGREFVPIAALEIFLLEERKNGRPVKELSISESYRRNLPSLVGKNNS